MSSAVDAVAGELHVISLHPQRALEDLCDGVVVLDDETRGGRSNSDIVRSDGRPLHSGGNLSRGSLYTSFAAAPPGRRALGAVEAGSPHDGHRKEKAQGAAQTCPALTSRCSSGTPARRSRAASHRHHRSRADRDRRVLGGVAYLSWSGGALGDGLINGLRVLFGALGYAVPAVLIAGGVLILMRELRPPARPMRTGLICLTFALTLALAAGTLGFGPGIARAHAFWRIHAMQARGGVLGQAQLWLVQHLFSTVGAHILAVFLLIAGLILVSGATLAGVIRATGQGVADTGRALRRTTAEPPRGRTRASRATVAAAPLPEPATAAGAAAADDQLESEPLPLLPPEPDTAELSSARPTSRRRRSTASRTTTRRICRTRHPLKTVRNHSTARRGRPRPPSRPMTSRRRAGTATRSPTTPNSSGGFPPRVR